MARKRPTLYPGHQHEWQDADLVAPHLARCAVCDLTMPRKVVEAFDTIQAAVDDYRAELDRLDAHLQEPDKPEPEQETMSA